MNKYILFFCLLSSPGLIYSAGGKGMTWGLLSYDPILNVNRLGCGGVCNAYTGDTLCNTKLPILCYSNSTFKRPPYNVPGCVGCAMFKEFYDGWSESYFTLSTPVLGTALLSQSNMNNICSMQFGPTFLVAHHHMGKFRLGMSSSSFFYSTWPSSGLSNGGWAARGYGNVNGATRFWVFISGQPANCWNP